MKKFVICRLWDRLINDKSQYASHDISINWRDYSLRHYPRWLTGSPVWNQTWTDRLKQDLFVKYDKFARPTQHFNTTVVKFDITLLYVDVASMRDITTRNRRNFIHVILQLAFLFEFQDDFKSTITVNGWANHVCEAVFIIYLTFLYNAFIDNMFLYNIICLTFLCNI